jgi:hypothetical protein
MSEQDSQKHISFLESVLLRPKMYTIRGSYEETVAFLDGYTSGFQKGYAFGGNAVKNGHEVYFLDVSPTREWSEISNQLCSELDVDAVHIFERFRERFTSDEDATSALFEIVKKHMKSTE